MIAAAQPSRASLSIVVPVLDEAPRMPALITSLAPLASAGVEIVFVDGGSHDNTVSLADMAAMTVVHSAAGRALQMNAGAAATRGDILLFLHADTTLPVDAHHLILDAMQRSGRVWGRFDVYIEGSVAMLPIIAFMMNLRSRLTGIATGDQAMFMTRRAFDTVSGFPPQPLMEDVEVSRRLRRLSHPACLREHVRTSGRRWETRGTWRTIFLMWRLRWAYWRGERPEILAERYR